MNPMPEEEFRAFLQQANWSMRGLMDENRKAFQLDAFPRFDWSQWRGELVFSAGGVPKVVARIQVAGSHSAKSKAWTWAWSNAAWPASVRQAALKARAFGEERGVLRFIQPKWTATESDAWAMTAVTVRLAEAKGAWRCPAQGGFMYLILTDIRAVSDRKRLFGARTCSHVLEEDRPILLVSRETDGEVLAVCGGEDDSAETTRDIPLDQLLALDPTLTALADMPDGWAALRESPDQSWTRTKAE